VGRIWTRSRTHQVNQLARLLKGFHVSPRKIRFGEETARGYLLSDFKEAFDSYPAFQIGTPEQPNGEKGFSDSKSGTRENGVPGRNEHSSHGESECAGVPVQNAEIGEKELF
jgi:Protein of unknown function (DUF3631)